MALSHPAYCSRTDTEALLNSHFSHKWYFHSAVITVIKFKEIVHLHRIFYFFVCFLHFVFNFEMVSMCCVFRSLPVVAGIWLIITFECTCYASIEVTTTFKPNKLDCNLTEAIDISDGKMGDDKSVVFNGTTFTEDYYIVNEEKRYMACPPGDPTAELTSPSESILPKSKFFFQNKASAISI